MCPTVPAQQWVHPGTGQQELLWQHKCPHHLNENHTAESMGFRRLKVVFIFSTNRSSKLLPIWLKNGPERQALNVQRL